MIIRLLFSAIIALCLSTAQAQQFVLSQKEQGAFAIVSSAQAASIYVASGDDWLVHKAASLLQTDIEMVTGRKLVVTNDLATADKNCIIIGTVQSAGIQQLLQAKKTDNKKLQGQWEAFSLQTVASPFQGMDHALVITGSDKRGVAYGVFELSKQLGVSPWYWWADVPVKKNTDLYVKQGVYNYGSPSVQYRGIFINDEAPAFSGWTKEKFGGVNHLVYEKMFELLLRLKANYLWPAMWSNAFNDDDTLNPILAHKWGIVMGTTHHEPMQRAQQEWKRYGKGQWNYDSNGAVLRDFWRKGIGNMAGRESIVSIGMRGDGDMPMTQGTAITLLEKVVADQRTIIEEVTRKPAAQTPQLWALYKEVQDYYDKGMRVPDDVTLLLYDDNWGNIRKLPKLTDKPRSGGYGIYYHYDYVGGPRNYKWINTNNIARVWEQMHLAYEYGVNKIWIVNVGDLKPMEFPISFFLDYAWNTKKWNEDNLPEYYTQWASEQFGKTHAKEIGAIIATYSQYNARRKPELLDANTYSLTGFDEADRVVKDYNRLLEQAEIINGLLPAEYKDAYFQLVLHPVKASANLHELYVNVAWNRYYAARKMAVANSYAEKARQLYKNDSLITLQYHRMNGGKWNYMMDQTHIGYTYWQQPPFNRMPEVKIVPKDSAVPEGLAVDSVQASLRNMVHAGAAEIKGNTGNMFYTYNQAVSMEAANWTKAIHTKQAGWKVIPGIGRTASGITTFPVTASSQLSVNAPHVEYEFYSTDSGKAEVSLYFSPTLNFHNNEGLQYAVSIDDEAPQTFSLNKDDNNLRTWEGWVANNVIICKSTHHVDPAKQTRTQPGRHLLKYWMISPAIVLQKIVVGFGNQPASYLGTPETRIKPNNNQGYAY